MPNRIIKESLWTSEKISDLTDFEFRVWIALITLADDAGRGDARAAIIRGRAFPLRDGVTNKNVESAVRKLASNGCITLYTVGGHCYYCFPTWNRHQRVRDCKPKYPGPDECDDPQQSAAICGELPQVAEDCGLNPIQSESNPNPNPSTRVPRGVEREKDAFADLAGENKRLRAALSAFAEMRKKLRKPLTERAKELTVQDLKKLSENPEDWIEILNQSIKNSWQGVFPLKVPMNGSQQGGKVTPITSAEAPGEMELKMVRRLHQG